MHEVCSWGCALYYGDDTGDEGKASALRVSYTLKNATLRQIIRTTIGGDILRLTFSNEYGQTPMALGAVHIAEATVLARSDIDTSKDTAVTFGGGQSVTIPAGERVTSDPVAFKAQPLQRLAVSIYFGEMPERVACHVGARANSFIAYGNAVSDETLSSAVVNTHWFVLSNVDVLASSNGDTSAHGTLRPFEALQYPHSPMPTHEAIVVLGDSITDGYGVDSERYTRWTDIVAERLQADPSVRYLSVVNMGIGTNHLLRQDNPPAAVKRFERDVLGCAGIGHFIFLIGINDLAFTDVSAEEMIGAYKMMINAAKVKKIKVYPCTIMPYNREDPRRHAVNNWLRETAASIPDTKLIDFDALVRDAENPDRMKAQFDNDGIHPNEAAYAAMGEFVYSYLT